jgi:hypothetical protein
MGRRFNVAGGCFWACSVYGMGDAMTKIDSVYLHLKKHKHITSWEAINLYRATRLADIVFKLKEQGFKIETVMIQGENTRFARYYLH